jgi:hypothetical protein
VIDQLLGPTAGKIEALTKLSGAAGSLLVAEKPGQRDKAGWTADDTKALRRLTFFNALINFISVIILVSPSCRLLDIPPYGQSSRSCIHVRQIPRLGQA